MVTNIDNEFFYSKDELSEILEAIGLHSNIELLYKHLNIVNSMNDKNSNRFFIECISILDLICILEMKSIARCIYEGEDPDLDLNIDTYYLGLIRELEIDFKLFIVYAGEDFFKSDYYEYDGEIAEEQVLKYLIVKHYGKAVSKLKQYYKDPQSLLLDLIEDQDFYDSYLQAVEKIDNLEDCFDYGESMRLYEWASTGFSWNQ